MTDQYAIELVRDGDQVVAWHPELPGCVAQGSSADEAIASLDDARETWLSVRTEDGLPIAAPKSRGRLLVRVPIALHSAILRRAEHEGVSANHLISAILSAAIGQSPLFGYDLEKSVRPSDQEIVTSCAKARG